MMRIRVRLLRLIFYSLRASALHLKISDKGRCLKHCLGPRRLHVNQITKFEIIDSGAKEEVGQRSMLRWNHDMECRF